MTKQEILDRFSDIDFVYNNSSKYETLSMMLDELLKDQEAVEPINSYGTVRCGNCGNIVGYDYGYGRGYQNNFCSECGKAVKWNAWQRIKGEV